MQDAPALSIQSTIICREVWPWRILSKLCKELTAGSLACFQVCPGHMACDLYCLEFMGQGLAARSLSGADRTEATLTQTDPRRVRQCSVVRKRHASANWTRNTCGILLASCLQGCDAEHADIQGAWQQLHVNRDNVVPPEKHTD